MTADGNCLRSAMEENAAVDLIAINQSGPAALLARDWRAKRLAEVQSIWRIRLRSVTDAHDPMMLPGALKYGGVQGFIPLCDSGLPSSSTRRKVPLRAALKRRWA